MKIPSPGPLDDRGVLCGDKYRFLLDYVKGAGLKILGERLGLFLKCLVLFIPLKKVEKSPT